MKAIFFKQHGELDVLQYGSVADPEPAPGEALVRVKAVALNHLDIWVRRGWRGLHLQLPHVTGSDVAGEIVTVNANSSWEPGTRVIVNPGLTTTQDEWTRRGEDSLSPGYQILGEQRWGGLAELVTVPLGNVYKTPEHLTDEEAAAPLLTGLSCWRMLFARGQLRPGETVLIVGVGGGLNSLALQIAAASGARVYALTSSAEKAERAQLLGAAEVLDYRAQPDWHREVLQLTKGRGVDLVIDNVGAATFKKSLAAVRRGGRIVTVGNTSGYQIEFDNRHLFAKQISLIGSTMGSRQDFVDAMQFLWERNIKAVIDRVVPLAESIDAIRYIEEGRQFGKIVVKP